MLENFLTRSSQQENFNYRCCVNSELRMIEMHPLFLFHRFTEKFKIDLFFI